MWFAKAVAGAVNYMVEPDPDFLKIGQHNFALNNLTGTFINAYIGDKSRCSGSATPQIKVDDIIDEYKIPFVGIVHGDIQSADYSMLLGCKRALKKNKIGYFFISTHTDEIHSRCLDFLISHDFHIVAQHAIKESCSADGLIVARSNKIAGINSVEVTKL